MIQYLRNYLKVKACYSFFSAGAGERAIGERES
jgi:hypothetical protein